jgi:hypothetical protein
VGKNIILKEYELVNLINKIINEQSVIGAPNMGVITQKQIKNTNKQRTNSKKNKQQTANSKQQ